MQREAGSVLRDEWGCAGGAPGAGQGAEVAGAEAGAEEMKRATGNPMLQP